MEDTDTDADDTPPERHIPAEDPVDGTRVGINGVWYCGVENGVAVWERKRER